MTAPLAVVVPTLGRSPDLAEVAGRLAREASAGGAELLFVAPESVPLPRLGDPGRALRYRGPSSFARAANLGVAAVAGDVALVNDDALVEAGWLARLTAELAAQTRLGAVQGVNLELERPTVVDGCGLGWNRDWQAVQEGRGGAPPEGAAFEVFGVSATAALYRRRALDEIALGAGRWFDERLGSWYEDVELAGRLRAGGWCAACVPSARALHRGSATGATMPFARGRLLARNRWLAVARLLGGDFRSALPRLVGRDLRDFARRLAAGELAAAAALVAGVVGAGLELRGFVHAGAPLVAAGELARLRVGSAA
jgi:GT2 family glycosyltransferase